MEENGEDKKENEEIKVENEEEKREDKEGKEKGSIDVNLNNEENGNINK